MNKPFTLSSFIQIAAVVTVFAAILLIVPDAYGAVTGTSTGVYQGTTLEQVWSALWLIGKILLVFGLIGLYLHHMDKAGIFGFIAFLVALFGTAAMIGSDWSELFIAPIFIKVAPGILGATPTSLKIGFMINYVLETLGWLLFGVSMFRTNVYPRYAAVLLMIGAILQFSLDIPWIILVMNGAILWMAILVLNNRNGIQAEQVRQ